MPRGTWHEETGLLVEDRGWLYLRRDDGGHWRLDAPRKARALLGRRVTLRGQRVGFDVLDVKTIERSARVP